MKFYPTALSIAGSDPSGGAGIQADIKTMSALGVYAMTAITALTVQNTTGVRDVAGVNPEIVAAQINAVLDDIYPGAVKIGMLFSAGTAGAVADILTGRSVTNIVLDPVMVSTSGDRLMDDSAIEVIVKRLIPAATLITPNVREAEVLTGTTDIMQQIAALRSMGAKNILLKGGDRNDGSGYSIDRLVIEGSDNPVILESKRVMTANTHGTGCTLSSAIASFLARGYDIMQSVTQAKRYVTEAIRSGADISVGHGHGPVNHLFSPVPLEIITK